MFKSELSSLQGRIYRSSSILLHILGGSFIIHPTGSKELKQGFGLHLIA